MNPVEVLDLQLRTRFRELRDLVNSWDPIDFMDEPDWSRDEYECVVGTADRAPK